MAAEKKQGGRQGPDPVLFGSDQAAAEERLRSIVGPDARFGVLVSLASDGTGVVTGVGSMDGNAFALLLGLVQRLGAQLGVKLDWVPDPAAKRGPGILVPGAGPMPGGMR